MAKQQNQTKEKILKIALELFEKHGFDKVTINEICKQSGFGKHTFYYYFDSKDDLLKDYYEVPFLVDGDYVANILSAQTHFERLWQSLLPMLLHVSRSGTDIARQLFIKNLSDDVGTFRARPDMKSIIAMQIDLITRGQQEGEFRNASDPANLEKTIRQIAIGTSFTWCMMDGRFDILSAMRCALEDLLDVLPNLRQGDYATFESLEEQNANAHCKQDTNE